MLRLPARVTGLGPALSRRRRALVKAAEAEAAAVTEELDVPERDALRKAFGEGSTGKGVAKAVRGAAGALKDLEDRQKSRATRLKRDSLDRALLDLAASTATCSRSSSAPTWTWPTRATRPSCEQLAAAVAAGGHRAPDGGIMTCRERLELNVAPLLAVEEMALALLAGEQSHRSWAPSALPAGQKAPRSWGSPRSGQRSCGWRVQ